MDFSKYNDRGLTGLVNLGNTCFLNSCVQVLSHTYELHELLDKETYLKHLKTDLPDAGILLEWNELRKLSWTNNGTISPNKFVHHVQKVADAKGRELFTGWAQNDMPEFLLFMIECMHNSISRPMNMIIRGQTENITDQLAVHCYAMLKEVYSKEYSEIMPLFYGIYVSQIMSVDQRQMHSMKPENYFMLDLPVPNKPAITLYDCFDAFTHYEVMQGDNAWYNEKTGKKEDVKKGITFWNFPSILVITLKRFSFDGRRKIGAHIDFPLDNLDLSKYVKGYNPRQYVYDLFGVCNHIGGVSGGHYTSFVKVSDGSWKHFNDSKVGKVDHVVTPMAYCLFYRKKYQA
jgi:ubiquitin carboxyl-terminal hydrolase 8